MPSQTFFNLPQMKRQNITNAAIAEFVNHSYESASISAIVNRAKIAKGSFYQYFKDKQDLYLYLVDRALEARNAFIAEANLPSVESGFFVFLQALFQTILEFQLANPRWSQILFRGPQPSSSFLLQPSSFSLIPNTHHKLTSYDKYYF
ncbi:MAG: TetR/AcrR family transcriptional regulator [Cyanobacteria bacterium P01_H01_bin.150]